jgi:hypothetical protein
VPSLHLAVAPVGSVLPAVAVGADLLAVDDFAAVAADAVVAAGATAAGVAVLAGAAGVAVLAGAAGAAAGAAAFCTPPWPLQVPFPVDVVVVPSLQVVGAGSAAGLGIAHANASKGAAMRPATVIFFMKVHSLVLFDRSRIVNRI